MIQKWLYLGNRQSNLLQNLTQCSWGCAAMMSRVHTGVQNVSGMGFLAENKERYNLECFLDVQCPA